jgi:glycosyltransferase involved in cell wall biosynthesis
VKIAVNARLLASPNLRGWNRYTINLLAELAALGHELVLCTDQPVHATHLARLPAGSFVVREHAANLLLWENAWLPRQCARDGARVLHAPASSGLPWRSPVARVLTLHDAIDATHGRGVRSWGDAKAQFLLRIARTRAERVIAPSEHARAEIARTLGVPEGRIDVVAEAADPSFTRALEPSDLARARAAHGLARPYVLYVGGWEQRKNVPFLVRAFAAAALDGVDLVLGGGRPEEVTSMRELARGMGVEARVKLCGWIDERDLAALFAPALAFVLPSEAEGFGLQLVEAMAAGCPVLAARATSLPEVLGPGGETFALSSEGELAALLGRVARDAAFRADLARRAKERGASFSWRRSAERTIEVYERAIRERRP